MLHRSDRRRGSSAMALCGLALAIAARPAPASGAPAADSPAESRQPPAVAGGFPAFRYCPVCGAQNRPDNRFCLKDGTPLPPIDTTRRMAGFVRSPGTYSADEIEQVMHRVSQSVVRIRVRTTTTYKFPIAYYKDGDPESSHGAQIGTIETSNNDQRLAGSGFVISQDGEIVTNAHVAAPDGMKADLTVETQDGRTFPAGLVGADAASDLALLRIEAGALPPLAWGDSSAIRVGQETWAIGNPLDIGISIARGTMSSITGTRVGMNQIESFLHSDAHITHGNSGGPLVDVTGQVLGVSDMVYSESRGQGYSIPSRMTRLVIDRLRKGGYERGFIGLQVEMVDQDNTKTYALKRGDGSVVVYILPGSPAERAGFRRGDVLYGINGHSITSTYQLQEAVSSVGPASPIKVMVDRGGQAVPVEVTTALRPAAPRVDPLEDIQSYLRIRFEEDSRKKQVFIRDPHHSQRAPGLYEGFRVKSVLPAEMWPEEPITLNYYKTRAKPIPIDSLEDLKAALKRAYLGGRVAVTFEIDYPSAPIASLAFDDPWPIVL